MNREIKFRVWDTSERIMSAGVPFSWFITGHPEDMLFPTTKETLPLHDFVRYFGDFILMQFTGLMDKNGKEIYEGDILKNPNTPQWFNWLVSFHDGAFVIQNIGINGYMMDQYPLSQRNAMDRCIVGNCHENHELLNNL